LTDRYGDPLPPGVIARFGTPRLRHPGGPVECLAFSPDGKFLASGSIDFLCLWDRATGKEIRRFPGRCDAVAYSPDGKLVASAGLPGKIRLREVTTGRLIAEWGGSEGSDHRFAAVLGFSSDGKRLAFASSGEVAYLWEVPSGRALSEFKLLNGDLTSALALSPDARLLASATRWVTKDVEPGPICLWDTATGKKLYRLAGHKESVQCLAFSADGKTLVTVVWGQLPVLREARTGRELLKLGGQNQRMLRLAFSPDGRMLATGSGSDGLCLWDAATGKRRPGFRTVQTGEGCLAFAPDGKVLAVTNWSGRRIRLLDVTSGEVIGQQPEPEGPICFLGLFPDSKTLAVGSDLWDGNVFLWQPFGAGRSKRLLKRTVLYRPALSPDGKLLAFGGDGPLIGLHDADTGTLLRGLVKRASEPCLCVFSPDSKSLAVDAGGGRVDVFDVASGKRRFVIHAHEIRLDCVAYSPDGRLLATARGCELALWEAATGKLCHRMRNGPEGLNAALVFAPDSATLASLIRPSDVDEMSDHLIGVTLWNVASGRRLYRVARQHGAGRTLAFSPDGRTLACENVGNEVSLWEVASGKERRRFAGHQHGVGALAFSRDGRWLISGGLDATVLVWDLATPGAGQRPHP
jgi:WD40 repeat protein